MNNIVMGVCSQCGGSVEVPRAWWSIYPPVPRCVRCGATPKARGPIIETEGGRK